MNFKTLVVLQILFMVLFLYGLFYITDVWSNSQFKQDLAYLICRDLGLLNK